MNEFFVVRKTIALSETMKILPSNCLSVFDHFVRLALKGFRTKTGSLRAAFEVIFQNYWKSFLQNRPANM